MRILSQRDRAGAILTIDLDAIRANYRLLRARAAPAACAAVLKADAYGLGAVPIGLTLYQEGCRHFFVAHLDEGIALRPHLAPDAAIFVLHGPPLDTDGEFISHSLIPVLNSLQQIDGWRRLARTIGRALPAVVQVDSGMSRMGLPPAEVDSWLADPQFLDGIRLRYLMSHLACADQPDNSMNRLQLARFRALRGRLPDCPASLANSSAIFLSNDYHFDLVRPGAALYGIAPTAGMPNPMRPVVRLQGKVIQTRTIVGGDHVGYSLKYTAAASRQIATVSVGYADGWLRTMSNRGIALIDGIQVPQIGNISMDSITLDVSALPTGHVVPGILVDLICPEHPLDVVAGLADTIGYEILTNLGPRFYREYIGRAADNCNCLKNF